MTEPDNLVLQLLRDMRAEMANMRANMATKDDIAAVRAEMHAGFADVRSDITSLRADVASDLHQLDGKIDTTRRELSEQIVGLRRAVVEYHSAVIGHGMIISDLEARPRRVEQHLNLPSGEGH